MKCALTTQENNSAPLHYFFESKRVLRSKNKKGEESKMAIFHATTKPISRSSGRSATASAAYRAGCKIDDDRTGLKHDYSKKSGVLIAAVFDKNNMQLDRSELWNLAEKAENRKDGRTAREWILAIPNELVPQRSDMYHDNQYQSHLKDINKNHGAWVAFKFAQELAKRYNVAVDVAIHAPDKGGDNRNYHAHIMTTTRELKNENGKISLGDKSAIELSNTKRKDKNLCTTDTEITELRALWAKIVNDALEFNNSHERIDHRSHKDRGIERQPTIKVGWRASAMERRGIETERGTFNKQIVNKNKKIEHTKNVAIGEAIYQKSMREIENIHRARLDKQLKDIAKRTPFDLLKIMINVDVRVSKDAPTKTEFSGDMLIGQGLGDALYLKKQGYVVDLKAGNNKHLEHSEAAQNIKKFIFKNLGSFETVKDFGELSIDKFTDKYAIECDLSDLTTIHEQNPVTTAKAIQQQPTADFSEPLKRRTNDNDLTM